LFRVYLDFACYLPVFQANFSPQFRPFHANNLAHTCHGQPVKALKKDAKSDKITIDHKIRPS
jgi:hypothetical protein